MGRVVTPAEVTQATHKAAPTEEVELTILMPCLNEAETLATCIRKARGFLETNGIDGEVVIADNGSTDGSREIAAREGARMVPVPARGYGAALLGGIAAARGRYTIMGDADDSYDFSNLMPFLEQLRAGNDLVMGNRFKGGIAPGAMKASHKYLGNPVLSWLGRLFFRIPVGDFHSGLRGFNTARIRELGLSTMGMEFASEMVVRSALAGYKMTEVPTTLAKDGRSRPPHLRTWRDGWRHLRFLLIYSPRWLFLYPGIALFALGLLGIVLLFPGELRVGTNTLGVHTFVAACMVLLIGVQAITFAAIARRYATARGLLPPSVRYSGFLRSFTPERLLVVGLVLFVVALIGLIWSLLQWIAVDFGPLNDQRILKVLTLSFTGVAAAVQLWLAAFLASLMEIAQQNQRFAEGDSAGEEPPAD